MIGAIFGLTAMLGVQAAAAPDLRQPGNVVSALQAAGYKAQLKLNKAGEPFIESATNGEPFTVDFYECDGLKDCKSLQLWSWYKKEPVLTPEVANEWNAKRRFMKVWIDSDGDMRQSIDATVVGGMTQAQFAEIVQWYTDLDGMFSAFLKEKRDAAKGKAPARP